jgi:hypothetical protein
MKSAKALLTSSKKQLAKSKKSKSKKDAKAGHYKVFDTLKGINKIVKLESKESA